MSFAYYNEHDEFASEWLKELIRRRLIADGMVDTRSIEEVKPDDIREFTQCHFFAGIGGWSLSARMAGIPDDFPLWTGSCPCQSFSEAGKRRGLDDNRHLWPVFHKLIDQCRPPVVVGEQVESAIRHGWLDIVQSDMENSHYAFGSASLSASSVGAPHIRQRLYWGGVLSSLDDSDSFRRYRERAVGQESGELERLPIDYKKSVPCDGSFWANAEWREGRDKVSLCFEPGAQPLAYGVPERVGRLRGYGNAIVPQVGAGFLKSLFEAFNVYRMARNQGMA